MTEKAAALLRKPARAVRSRAPSGKSTRPAAPDLFGRAANAVAPARAQSSPAKPLDEDLRFQSEVLRQVNEAVIALDAEENFTYLNPAAERQYGVRAAEALGRPRAEVYERRWADPALESAAYEALRRTGFWRGEVVHVRRDGSALQVESAVSALKDRDGRLVGTLAVIRDMTERMRYESELAATKDDLARQVAGLTRLHDLAMRLPGERDLQSTLEAILEAAAEIHGTDRGLLSVHEAETGMLRVRASVGFDAKSLHALRAVKPGSDAGACGMAFFRKERVVIEDTAQDPRCESLRGAAECAGFRAVHSTPIFKRTGEILGVLSLHFGEPRRPAPREMQLMDMCARYAAEAIELANSEKALLDSTERMRIAQQAAQWGVFDYDVATGADYWSPEMEAIYGLRPGEYEGTLEAWRRRIHPEDHARVRAAYQDALRSGEFTLDYRIVWPDGRVRWVFSRAKMFFGAGRRPKRILGVNVDITQRKQAEEALREADRRKDEFLATLAHELRNPLAPLRNGVEILRRAGGDPATVERVRDVMDRQLGHMVRLIDDLLDLARVGRGTIELRRERVELATALRTAIETSRPLIETSGHQLTTRIPLEPMFVHADLTRLAQVFSNLLNNAAKYTPNGGRILLAMERHEGRAVVTVTDNGIGIPQRTLADVFDMFSQVDRSLEKTRGGLGIGLTIVKRLLEMQGGSIEAKSDGEGKGSQFVVSLPLLAQPVKETRSTADAAARVASAPRLGILLADDNADAAVTLAQVLELSGHQVHVANDGLSAVESAASLRPDVVLLDIGMPGLNGYEACRRIRGQAWAKDVLLIALTGWGQEDHRRRAQEAGFDHHLIKPVDPAALQDLLASRKAA